MNIFQELQKRGYQITNKRVLGNPHYTSEETRRKDLIQELALVVDWINEKFNIHIGIEMGGNIKDKSFIFNTTKPDKQGWYNESLSFNEDEFKTPQEATIAAIEYLIENKSI